MRTVRSVNRRSRELLDATLEANARLSGQLEELLTELAEKRSSTDSWLRAVTFDIVIVHTTDERSIQGLLAAVTDHELVLEHAKYLTGANSADLAGRVMVPRARVAFVQRPNPMSAESP